MLKDRFKLFSTLMTSVGKNIEKLKTKYSKEFSLKPVHMKWIYFLDKYPEGLSSSELAKKSLVNRSLVSREINYLFEQDLIYTKNQKRYGEKLFLTEAGKQKARMICNLVDKIQSKIGKNISNEDLETFYNVLTILALDFENILEENIIDFQEIKKV